MQGAPRPKEKKIQKEIDPPKTTPDYQLSSKRKN